MNKVKALYSQAFFISIFSYAFLFYLDWQTGLAILGVHWSINLEKNAQIEQLKRSIKNENRS